ncbi:hypothetical protein HRbin15_00467 [bacterium HR15]|nr:hypothetical protein HRbin15_00467 [bacterium HR15]
MQGTGHGLRIVLGALILLLLWACSGGGGGGVNTRTLRVVGTPAGARVFVNGVERGTAPLDLSDLPPGTHHIRVEITLDNGQIIAQEFNVVIGSQPEVRYDLNRYRIETNPVQVEVWAGQRQQIVATMRDVNGTIVEANFVWSIENPNVATLAGSENNTRFLQGIARGSTYLIITDTRTGVSLRVPVTVLDFPPPPGG